MSSFVIGKEEYTKCAGFLAAIVEKPNYYREPTLRLWNKKETRLYTAEDVLHDFQRLYEINANAVALQYGNNAKDQDGTTYEDTFTSCKDDGKRLLSGGTAKDQLKAIFEAIHFFRSIQYQIEDEDNTRQALMILNKYYRGLYDLVQTLSGIHELTS